jgi:uncharacterized protein (DUF1499 family)
MSRLPECPPRPSCVSSDAEDARRSIAPLEFGELTAEAWRVLRELLEGDPQVEVLEAGPAFMHVVFRTRWLGFRDDVHLALREERGEIAMRSCSRVGYWDLGANRRRLEGLRRAVRTGLPA